MASSIEFQAFFRGIGGTGWQSNGSSISMPGSFLQAIQVRLVNPWPFAVITYDVHSIKAGWLGSVSGDNLAGNTINPNDYLDSLCIDISNRPPGFIASLNIVYKVQTQGVWGLEKKNGSSTKQGQGIEGIQIFLQ